MFVQFHSDSERGLGPVIASLSLGSTAEMHFRLQSKYTVAEGHRKTAMTIILRHVCFLILQVGP
jgi:2OG-Fe(II) oxygenase superfamily